MNLRSIFRGRGSCTFTPHQLLIIFFFIFVCVRVCVYVCVWRSHFLYTPFTPLLLSDLLPGRSRRLRLLSHAPLETRLFPPRRPVTPPRPTWIGGGAGAGRGRGGGGTGAGDSNMIGAVDIAPSRVLHWVTVDPRVGRPYGRCERGRTGKVFAPAPSPPHPAHWPPPASVTRGYYYAVVYFPLLPCPWR